MRNPKKHPEKTKDQPHSFNWLTATDTKTWLDERDACALVASIRKNGEATHGNLKRALAALSIMGHRSGEVNGEGDGCGVLTDIPRLIWAQALEHEGKPGWLAEDRRFFVGHFMIPNTIADPATEATVINIFQEAGVDILLERPIQTRPQALGKMARLQAPQLWQVAGLVRQGPLENVERILFDLSLKIERQTKISVASLSSNVVVYKVRGSIETLYQYYPELRNPDFTTSITIGHARYSTNTATSFERVQPFSLLGHNGEINTIARLREQSRMLGVELVEGGSDFAGFGSSPGSIDPPLSLYACRSDGNRLSADPERGRKAFSRAASLSTNTIVRRLGHSPRDLLKSFRASATNAFSAWMRSVYAHSGLGIPKRNISLFPKKALSVGYYAIDPVRFTGEKMRIRVRRGQSVEVLDYPGYSSGC